ncbi:MAG: hypothetical protein ACPGVO_09040 [Spirulinaceae cyanobacterium]
MSPLAVSLSEKLTRFQNKTCFDPATSKSVGGMFFGNIQLSEFDAFLRSEVIFFDELKLSSISGENEDVLWFEN